MTSIAREQPWRSYPMRCRLNNKGTTIMNPAHQTASRWPTDSTKEMLMGDQSNSEQSKAVVDAYYQAGVEGRLMDFAQYLHPDFSTTAPNYLPWGGVHPGAAFFRDEVLPNLPDLLDFGRFSYDVFIAADERVAALVNFGIIGIDAMIKISEHWTVRD